MKKMTAKATYSLDPLTALEIRELATVWDVSQSEVVRRAVHLASEHRDELGQRPVTPEEALDQLQRAPRLSPDEKEEWLKAVRAERGATRRP